MRRPLVIFHANCIDGTCAAWTVRQKFKDAEFRPWFHDDPLPEASLYEKRVVLILDFSFPRDVVIKMRAASTWLLLLDHHKTAAADLGDLSFCHFDMSKSGAGLAHDWFVGGPRPWVVNYVEDRDLWRNSLPHSAEIVAAIHELPRSRCAIDVDKTFATWDETLSWTVQETAERGRFHRMTANRLAAEIANGAVAAILGGRTALVAASAVLPSEVGHLLCHSPMPDGARPDLAATFYMTESGRWRYSLRSRGDVDVSQIAQLFGGGGHAAAAGFTSDTLAHELSGSRLDKAS